MKKVPTIRHSTLTPFLLPLLHSLLQGGCKPKVYNDIDGIQIRGDDVADTPAHDIPTQDVFPGVDVCWVME